MSIVVAGELGNVTLPVPESDQRDPFPAPDLDAIGAYLTAYLRAYCGDRWRQVAKSDKNIVTHFYTHDPEQYDFNSDHLPALYLWATGSERDPVRTAEDWRLHTNGIKVVWVLPNVAQEKQALRSRAIQFVGDTLDHAIELGRDPCWVVDGDPDPTAAAQGSVLLRIAGLASAHCGRWRPGRILIKPWSPKLDKIEGDLYDCLETKIVVEKLSRPRLGVDPSNPDRGAFGDRSLASPASLSLSVSVDGLTVSEATILAGYSMLYLQDGATAQTLGTTPTKLTGWTASGVAAGLEPDFANGKITVSAAGVYDVQAAFSVIGTAGRVAQIRLRKNDVEVAGIGGRAALAAAVGALALSPGLVACEQGDVLELYGEADVDSTDFTPVDGSFVVTRRQ